MGKLPFERIKREIFVRKEAETSNKYGKKPSDRSVEELLNLGIVNIDKPSGPTSHQVSAYVKQIMKIKKAGHSGTLDPQVTGVLPIAMTKATKVLQTLLRSGKEYVCIMHLHKPVDEYELHKVIGEFVGKIRQLPPVKSAVKREWRYRKVYYIDVIEFVGQDVLFAIGCQAGTYIRKICHDIGKKLGCGAHMAELRRTKAGPFNENDLFSLQDLTDAFHYYNEEGNDKFLRKVVKNVEDAVAHLPKVWVFDTTVDTICHGASLAVPGISKVQSDIQVGDLVAVFTLKDELICYGESKMVSKDMLKDKGLAVITDKVIMQPGTYPKMMHNS
ncbi:RNA-guided pseudouridylation complex pseudouridine synthase subunit Cbf5 [archaeon]|jgi:H/ACA ribonucleoprotein complex subunit 4|nr:RNA-guided pseudouridylation complex pseudouridine synthase subunit Cbf5 [archaeon]MBT4352052.1 RNA-guided pseudouridylation complex pseudouridine synthase subunit Cbf5 [archaeon]MBT4646738.1 RNA-guided pseudouridylation complex pseudouridine synthase subunit Cbf5 [archaeon]MBT6822384.1 RNA-guided pseudouridylation complex pseudouridine synthase subunit Cbf5 [archaeon]MBT7392903.1 RNA-guided pseudouridylation complex pseudouridine synthase subunit Cbf5 [archaeon]